MVVIKRLMMLLVRKSFLRVVHQQSGTRGRRAIANTVTRAEHLCRRSQRPFIIGIVIGLLIFGIRYFTCNKKTRGTLFVYIYSLLAKSASLT